MRFEMVAARDSLERLLAESDVTSGMYVRVHGKNLILGREEEYGGATERVDMVRLTERPRRQYGLSYKRHTGRWERMPFEGSLAELVKLLQESLAHMVAPLC